MPFDGILTVYNKNLEKIAVFPPNVEAISEKSKRNLIVSPTIREVSNGESSLTFEVLSDSETWDKIKDIENLYHINDKWYTVLSNDAYEYKSDNGVSVVSVVALETWALLSKKYAQIYNCGLYVYAKAHFNSMTTDGAVFTIYSNECSNPGKTISAAESWEQVREWTDRDAGGNRQSYAILSADGYQSTNWENQPSAVFMRSFSVSGNTATMTIESRTKRTVNHVFNYNQGRTYTLDAKPLPSKIDGIKVNSTTVTTNDNTATYNTSDKDVYNYSYNSNTGVVTINYYPSHNETVNAFTVSYTLNDLGTISPGATCWLAMGPEVVDETTVVILPKANKKYKLHVNGVSYDDSQVKDSRDVVMPRGSGGYCMWALLKSTSWNLGVCDVIADGFDTSSDYGVFNVELDQKDLLTAIQTVAQLYGGILDWDSEHKILNYRAENSSDYKAYLDGYNEWRSMVFREGKNMTEKPNITVDGDLITKAYLLGFGGLSVKGVNEGKSFIEDHSFTDAVFEGYLQQPLIHDTNTVEDEYSGQKQLLYWGKKELAKRCRPRESITLSVTDLRYLPEYSHEQFFLNDIVKVIYYDEYLNKKVEKEQRVIVWEYNAHALWESTVELGDVTLNKTDLFKLIYKKVENNPAADNSGNISGSNITVGGGFGTGGYETEDPNSLPAYIDLIARTTTQNSDAIAGLILDTSATHAQVDLFAYYQKHMDNLLTESYAGLTFYADEKKAEAILSANNYTEEKTKELDGSVTERISQTEAAFRAYADKKGSELEALATGYYNTLNSKIGQVETWAQAGFTAEQNERYALAQQFSSFVQQQNNNWIQADAKFMTYADTQQAVAQMTANFATRSEIPSEATVKAWANEVASGVTISAIRDGYAYLQVDSSGTISCSSSAYINLSSAGVINLGMDHGETVYIRGQIVQKMSARIEDIIKGQNGGYIYYFGWN